VPRRTLCSDTEEPGDMNRIARMRHQIKSTENAVNKVQKKLKEMSKKLYQGHGAGK